MIETKEIITLKREVWLNTPPQPSLPATITGVEENLFWTNLPRDGRQVLVLLENQEVKVGVSLKNGFYMAGTRVVAIGKDNNKFYGLAIPDEFKISQERQFTRVDYPTNVLFKSGDLVAQSALVNFSAGGVLVYFVPELEKIVNSNQSIILHLNIDNLPFQVGVRMAWKKIYDNIPFAGFEFINITPLIQGNLVMLSMELTKNKL